MENKSKLNEYLVEIEKWEKEQVKEFWFFKIKKMPFNILDKVTPKFIHQKIGQMLDEMGNFIQKGGQYLISEDRLLSSVQKSLNKPSLTTYDIPYLKIEEMNSLIKPLSANYKNVATVQGATTGIGGLWTIIADIPFLLSSSLKAIQEVAYIYGYNPNSKEERAFMIECLQFVHADTKTKEAILSSITSEEKHQEKMLIQLRGWKEVAMGYREHYGFKKLIQMIPIIGIPVGAYTNRSFIDEVIETASMLYQKRRVLDKIKALDKHDILDTYH